MVEGKCGPFAAFGGWGVGEERRIGLNSIVATIYPTYVSLTFLEQKQTSHLNPHLVMPGTHGLCLLHIAQDHLKIPSFLLAVEST
jgi:hypothetical protein